MQALREYAILDTPPEKSFDRLTELAAAICGTPISLVSLIDENRQWFKSRVGLDAVETSREVAFCQYAIQETGIFEIEDATDDHRFRDNPLVRSDPHIRFYAGQPLIDSRGNALGTLCVIDRQPRRLSTEQRRALALLAEEVMDQIVAQRDRRRLERSEQAFRNLFDTIPDLIHILDDRGRIVNVNRAWERTLGYGAEEWTGRDLFDLIHPDSREHCRAIFADITAGKFTSGERVSYTLVSKSLQPIEVEGALAIETEPGSRRQILSILRDVTMQRNSERALAHAHDLLAKSNEVAGIGVWEVTMETGRIHFDRTTRDIHEVGDAYEPTLARETKFFQGAGRRKLVREFIACVKTGRVFDLELELISARDRNKWVRVIGIAEFQNGDCRRVFGLCQDIDASNKIKIALKEADRSKTAFLANVSHEIRTPLNTIIGYPQLILQEIDEISRADMRRYAEMILDRGRHLLSLLNDIIDISKIESDQIALDIRPLDVRRFMESAQAALTPLARPGGQRLECVVDEAVGFADADDLRLQQVLANLVSNAVKASPAGARIRVRASKQGDAVEFAVSDEGRGIPSEKLAKIFDSFYRADTYAVEDRTGTGLGLAIVKRIVDLHGGSIRVDSRPDAGSVFTVALPASAAPIAQTEIRTPDADLSLSERLKGLQILIVEDDEMSRILLTKILEHAGFECTAVGSGEAALELVGGEFDLVFMDSQLPGISGEETMLRWRRLRRTMDRRPLPIVVLTANAMTDDPRRYIDLGFDAYESKPLIIDGLPARIAGYLRRD